MKSRTIKVDYLARVEGEGSLHVKLKDGAVEDVRLQIFEPPRFFEALLRGRDFTEAPDITARICGICPIAYLLGASRAMEDACGVEVTGSLSLLRRLIYCGEWIESHALHLFMLHAPDFLGYQDAVRMARDHPELVQRGLAPQEGRQRHHGAARRPRDPPHQPAGRRLLQGAGEARTEDPAGRSPLGPGGGPGRRSAGPPPCRFPTSSRSTSSWP